MTPTPVHRWLLALLTTGALVPLGAACGNTVEGLQEDTQDNVDQADDELNEGGDD